MRCPGIQQPSYEHEDKSYTPRVAEQEAERSLRLGDIHSLLYQAFWVSENINHFLV